MLYLGIDQHSKQLTVSDRNEAGDATVRWQVSTRRERVRAFFQEYRQRAEAEGGFVAILEVCGFNDWLITLLGEYSCRELILIQPQRRASRKTDRRDADALAELLWVNRQRLLAGQPVQGVRRVSWPSARNAEDRQLTVLRYRLVQRRTRTLNQIKHLLAKHNRLQECPTKGVKTLKARQWLAELALGGIDRLELNQLLAQWRLGEEQLAAVDAQIQASQAEHPTAAMLATIPGCAAYGSLGLACRVGAIERFPRPGSLANFRTAFSTALEAPGQRPSRCPRRSYAQKNARRPLTRGALSGMAIWGWSKSRLTSTRAVGAATPRDRRRQGL